MDESAGQREAEDNGETNERESRKSQDVTEWKEGTELKVGVLAAVGKQRMQVVHHYHSSRE
jgi:hypothetical protein